MLSLTGDMVDHTTEAPRDDVLGPEELVVAAMPVPCVLELVRLDQVMGELLMDRIVEELRMDVPTELWPDEALGGATEEDEESQQLPYIG